MNLVDYEFANGTFTKRELERLLVYRAAVAAGFYTDQDGSAEPAETHAPATVETAQTAELAEPKVAPATESETPESPSR